MSLKAGRPPMDIARQPRFSRFPKAVHVIAAAIALVAVVGLVTRAGTSNASEGASAGATTKVARAAVFTDKVRRGDLLREVPAQGTLIPEHVEWLSATSAGQVSRILLRAGADVQPGDLVAVLTNADLELAALDAERAATSAESALIQLDVRTELDAKTAAAGLVAMRADLGDAQRHATAADRMSPQGLMSDLDRADAVSKARALDARVASESARLNVIDQGRNRQRDAQRAELARLKDIAVFARRRLETLEIRAGIKGVLQDVPIEIGQWVAVGTTIAKVAEPGRLKAEVNVAEADAKDLRRGLAMRFEGATAMTGKVSRIDPNVAHGSVRIEVALEAVPADARPDQNVTGHIEIERLPNVLLVTRPAGATDMSTVSVFKLDHDGAGAVRTTARLGRGAQRARSKSSDGLSVGDEIVVSDIPGTTDVTSIRFK